MTECKKVFLDTAPLIYFLDDDVNYGEKMRCILEAVLGADRKVISSVGCITACYCGRDGM